MSQFLWKDPDGVLRWHDCPCPVDGARCPQTYTTAKPLVSDGLGCPPHMVPEFRKMYSDAGLTGVDVRDDGSVELTSRGDRGRRGAMKLRGIHDNDGGYGDG